MKIQACSIAVNGKNLAGRWLRHSSAADPAKPVLVFLHEALGAVALWRDFPEALCQRSGCDGFLYDRQGHGLSNPLDGKRPLDYLNAESWQVLPAVLESQGVGRALFIGHSDGGTIALMYASRFGQRCAGLVSMAAHVFVDEVTLAGIRATRDEYQRSGLRQRLAKYHGEKTDAVFAAWHETWCAPGFRAWNIVSLLPAVRCPLLVIQGEDDPYGTPEQVDTIVERCGGSARRLWLAGCGHIPQVQARERVLTAIAEFVEACAGAPAAVDSGGSREIAATSETTPILIRQAQAEDLPAVRQLLTACALPHADLSGRHLEHFLLAMQGSDLCGCVGIESYGPAGLLRSLAVASRWRGQGLGQGLVAAAETHAREMNIDTLYLLTTSAPTYFPRLGFGAIARQSAPPAIRESREFAGLCPASAVCLRKTLVP